MFLIIGIWGGANRIYAAFKFFLYTFFGSVLMLVAMVAMYVDAGTTDITALLNHNFGSETMEVMGFQILGGMQTHSLAGLLRVLRGENADVAGAHLVAGCARAGADGRLCRAGGDPVEAGRLRLPAVQPADVPGGV